MKSVGRFILLGGLAMLLSACGTVGFDKKSAQVDWSKGSIVVMSVEMTNEYRPNYGPTRLGIRIEKIKSSDERTHIGASEVVSEGANSVLVTQQIAPGSYTVKSLSGASFKFPINGGIDFTVNAPFEVPPQSVVYLGRVALVNKEKKNADDQATGSAIPLLDQAVAGFSGGTLQVALLDRYAQDMVTLKRDYPALLKADVLRAPLAQMTLDRTSGSKASVVIVKFDATVMTASPLLASGATEFAKLEDVDAVPCLSDRCKDGYRAWLKTNKPRTFAMSSKGYWGWASSLTPRDATRAKDPMVRALEDCNKNSPVPCKIYAQDDAVVWVK